MTYIKPTPSGQHGSNSGARMGRGDRRQVASGDGKWRNGHADTRSDTAGQRIFSEVLKGRPSAHSRDEVRRDTKRRSLAFWPPAAGSVFSSEANHTAWSTRGLQQRVYPPIWSANRREYDRLNCAPNWLYARWRALGRGSWPGGC
jgi:hypothetical protein